MDPPGDENDDVWSTDIEGAAELPRISLVGGLPRTPVRGSAVDRINHQPADLVHHRWPRVLDFKAIIEQQEQLLVSEQKDSSEPGTGYSGGVGDERSFGTSGPNLSRISSVGS